VPRRPAPRPPTPHQPGTGPRRKNAPHPPPLPGAKIPPPAPPGNTTTHRRLQRQKLPAPVAPRNDDHRPAPSTFREYSTGTRNSAGSCCSYCSFTALTSVRPCALACSITPSLVIQTSAGWPARSVVSHSLQPTPSTNVSPRRTNLPSAALPGTLAMPAGAAISTTDFS